MIEWQDINTAPEGVEVETMIAGGSGVRNQQTLIRRGRLWFLPDESMYVYYTPTHWQRLTGNTDRRGTGNGKDHS